MDAIEKEVCSKFGIQRRLSENRYDFVQRALRVVGGASPEEWSALSEEAQSWYNESVSRIEAGSPPKDFSKEMENSAKGEPPAASMYKKGAGRRAKEIMLDEDLKIKPAQLLERLKSEGYDYAISTLRVDVAVTRQLMGILRERGMLRD